MVNIGFRIMTVLSRGGNGTREPSSHGGIMFLPGIWVVDLWEVFFFFEVLKLAS